MYSIFPGPSYTSYKAAAASPVSLTSHSPPLLLPLANPTRAPHPLLA